VGTISIEIVKHTPRNMLCYILFSYN